MWRVLPRQFNARKLDFVSPASGFAILNVEKDKQLTRKAFNKRCFVHETSFSCEREFLNYFDFFFGIFARLKAVYKLLKFVV